jgi:hypothetical protein
MAKYKAFAFPSNPKPSPQQVKEFDKLSELEQDVLIGLLKDTTQPADQLDSKSKTVVPGAQPASSDNAVAFSGPSADWYEKNSKKAKKAAAASAASAGAAAKAAEIADAKRWKFANAIGDWFTKWGNLKIPGIAMRVDTMPEANPINDNLSEKFRKNLTNTEIKALYKNKKIVMRIDIYDTAASAQHAKLTPSGLLDSNAVLKPKTVTVTKGVKGGATSETIMQRVPPAYTSVDEKIKDKVTLVFTSSGGLQTETFDKYSGLKVLEKFVEPRTGRLNVNTNGSLIYNVQLASKTDSLLSTAHMQAGSFKTRSTLSPNGLQMKEYDLPIRVLPAQLSMNLKGCPLIEPYQEYLVDFDTGTSIDNVYSVIQVTHNISLGKFDTSLTFTPIEGYARVISYMNDLERQIEKTVTSQQAGRGLQNFQAAGVSLFNSLVNPFASTITPTAAVGASGTNNPGSE